MQAYGGRGFASKLCRHTVVMTALNRVRSLDKAAEDTAFPGFVALVINCLQFQTANRYLLYVRFAEDALQD